MIVGIDSATERVDAVALKDGVIVEHFSSVTFKKVPRGQALKIMREQTFIWLENLYHYYEEPTIFIEESIMVRSTRVAIQLAQTVGMLLSLPYPAYAVPIDSWKQSAVGKGGVSKQEVRAAIVSRFPETDLLFGTRQDLFDATGVALYGEEIVARKLD